MTDIEGEGVLGMAKGCWLARVWLMTGPALGSGRGGAFLWRGKWMTQQVFRSHFF